MTTGTLTPMAILAVVERPDDSELVSAEVVPRPVFSAVCIAVVAPSVADAKSSRSELW